MPMPTTVPVGFTDAFAGDVTKQIQWKAFMKKNQLDPIVLADVVNKLRGRFHDVGVITAGLGQLVVLGVAFEATLP